MVIKSVSKMKWCVLIVMGFVHVGVCHQNCRGEEPRIRNCDKVCDENNVCKIRAALLLPKNTTYDASLSAVGPVLDLAMQAPIIKDAFPSWLTVEWMKYDVTDCDAAYAVISAIDAYNDCAHVFFGPACDFALASVARIAKFLGANGTPLVTTGGFTFDFVKPKQTCQDEYYMLERAGPLGFEDLAYFIINLMRHFKWQQLLLINEPESQLHVAGKSTCHLMMKSFANFLKKEDILYTPWDTTSDGGLNYTENLKFYLGYKYTRTLPNTHSAVDVVLAMASILYTDKARTPGDLIWDSIHYSSDEGLCGFTVAGDSMLSVETPVEDTANPRDPESGKERDGSMPNPATFLGISEPKDLHTEFTIHFETPEERADREKRDNAIRPEEDITTLSAISRKYLVSYESGTLKEFAKTVGEILRDNQVHKGATKSIQQLIRVCNFLALTMLRCLTKNTAQVALSFYKEQYKKNLTSLVPCMLTAKFSPPSKACIEALSTVSKHEAVVNSFFAKLVTLWADDQNLNPNASAILGATVLTHTAWTGMGILHYLFEVCNHYSVSWKVILQETLLNTTKMTWKQIIEFCVRYQNKDKIDKTVAWARVIDDAYFGGMAVNKHISLMAILMQSVIAAQGDDGIKNSVWAQAHAKTIEHYRGGSIWLENYLSGTSDDSIVGTRQSSKLVKAISDQRQADNKKTTRFSLNISGIQEDDFDD